MHVTAVPIQANSRSASSVRCDLQCGQQWQGLFLRCGGRARLCPHLRRSVDIASGRRLTTCRRDTCGFGPPSRESGHVAAPDLLKGVRSAGHAGGAGPPGPGVRTVHVAIRDHSCGSRVPSPTLRHVAFSGPSSERGAGPGPMVR
jgi:hypothetical protein